MATFAQLKARVVSEMNRDDLADDLESQLELHLQRACEYYADTRLWFNAVYTTAVTAASTQSVAVPATVRRVERVTIPALDTELKETSLEGLPDDTLYGQPEWFCYYNDTLLFYPIPDAVYTLGISGVAQIDAPTDDADTSAWTDEAQDLITSQARFTLYRDQFRDPEGAQMARGAVQDAFGRLQRETARRLRFPLRSERRQSRFNINRGW